MKETKLEDGETCNDSTVDPDIALSYIDEKLQDVLGHFQKDFEDGVSSENLGSKFGGYGSFLPTYQRSPSWTCARAPPDAYNNNVSISPNNLHPEGGQRPSLVSSSTSLSGRSLASSAYSSTIVPALKAPAANRKTNSALPPAQDEDSTSKSEIVKKPKNLSDPKAPKLHTRVGIEDLSTQKKAEIYSGLGLDVSPSSSLDDSPINSEGLSHDLKDSRYESPTSILQIMTSYPMHDGLLLSPLSDGMICLTEKGKLSGEWGSERMIQESLETSVALVNGTHYANRKASEARKWKYNDKDVLGTGYGNGTQNGSAVQSKEEVDVNFITCEELVSEALKRALLSNPNHNVADPPKDAVRTIDGPRTAVRVRATEELFNCSSVQALGPVTAIETDAVERSDGKIISSGRIMETECHDQTTDVVKEAFVVDSSVESKSKKTFYRDTLLSKNGSVDMKKNHVKDRYRDFFGDIKAEEDDGEAGLQETHSPEKLKVSDAVGNKSLVEHNSSIKERVNDGKTEKPCLSGEYHILASKGQITVDALHARQDNQNLGVQAIDFSGKTRHGSKGSSSGTKQDGSQSSYYVMMNHQENPNCRSSSGTSHSLDENCHQHLGVPNKSVVEKRRHKNKEKKISLENHSDGGTKDAKTRNISEAELDASSEEIKRDDWTFCPVVDKPGWSSSSGLSHNVSGKIQGKYENRDSEDDSKKDLVSAKSPEAHISDVSMHIGKCDNKDSSTKRKWSALRDSLTCNPQDSMEKICDDICRKEKKARVSKSDKKDTSASKGSAGTGQIKKEQQAGQDVDSTLSLQSVKAEDSSKRDISSSSFPTSSPKMSSDGIYDGFSNQSSIFKKDSTCNDKSYELEFSEADLERKDAHIELGTEVKAKTMISGYATHQDADVNVDPLCQASQYACKTENPYQGSDKERKNDYQCQNSGSVSNGRRGSSSRNNEKNRAQKSDSDQLNAKNPDILNLFSDQMPLDEEKMAPGKNKSQDKSVVGSDGLKKSSKKDPSGKLLDKNVKGDNQSRFGHHDVAGVRSDVVSRLDERQAALPDRDDHRSFKKLISNISEKIEISSKSPLTRDQYETVVFKEPVPGSERENGANLVIVDASERERSNASRQGKKAKIHHGNLPNCTANKVRDLDVPSSVRKDSSSQAATNAIKEATSLKHLADRLKNSGSSESTGIYFQAALKFLHGASLLELDTSKHGEVNQSRRIYSSTAKLCQFCAHEYEKLKDMAAAALAYKCMEVAYMRVVYSSQSDTNRYRNELQTALQYFPPGESPFSSVSDVDNFYNPTIVDKAASAKVVGSPQVAGTHVVSARNGSTFMRLINLAQEVNFAMEASRKSRVAFAATNSGHGDSQGKEGALSVKKALDFNFQDVDGLLRLVRVAMEGISH